MVNSDRKSISLIGMPGAGKSTIAKYINQISDFNNIEVDELIETIHHQTLYALISSVGEETFKLFEETAILGIDTNNKNVISTGGSVIYSDLSMKHLSKTLIIYLKCNFETIKNRTENFTNRAIVFNGLTPLELYHERDVLYTKYSDIVVDATNLAIGEIAELIINL